MPNYDLSAIAKKANLHRTYLPRHAEMQVIGNTILVSLNSQELQNLPIPAETL